MLELPESQTIAAQMNEVVLGKRIVQAAAERLGHKFAFFNGEPDTYRELLLERTIGCAEAIGGQVEIVLEDQRLLLGDGINIRYFADGDKLPPKRQLYLGLEDGSAVVCTVQMYGGMWLFRQGENDNPYYLVAKEKPSPLLAQFDETYFQSILAEAKPTLSAKALLATEQRIPGLGNGTLQDILFRAGVNPKSKLKAIGDEKLAALFSAVKQTLADMTARGGRDTEKDLFGRYGGYQTILSKKTWQQPCPVCASTIIRQAYLGGNVYYCPVCQPL